MNVERANLQPGETPYYFNYVLILDDGTRISQYDERMRIMLWGKLPKGIKDRVRKVEVFVSPAFLSGTPTYIVDVYDLNDESLVYHGAQPVEDPEPYLKQRFEIRWVLDDRSERCISFIPGDWETAGREPDDTYRVEIN